MLHQHCCVGASALLLVHKQLGSDILFIVLWDRNIGNAYRVRVTDADSFCDGLISFIIKAF